MSQKPKYRVLSDKELSELEKEFVDFLVLNGIVADDWVKIKTEQPDKANHLIVLFSDVILEGSLRKIEYLESRSKNQLNLFRCLKDKIELVGISVEDDTEVNFLDQEFINRAVSNPPKGLAIYSSDKKYNQTREHEIFTMLQSGCLISNEVLFKRLCLML